MAAIVHHSGYVLGLPGMERLHPFDRKRASGALESIQSTLGRTRVQALLRRPAGPADQVRLETVHETGYLDALTRARAIADVIEVPQAAALPAFLLDRVLLRPMRLAVEGTVLAARIALAEGAAVNSFGGFHHAKPGKGEGFCAYADAMIAVATLRAEGLLAADASVAHVDGDAHMGNGVAHCAMADPRIGLFDMFHERGYPRDPAARARIDVPHALPSDIEDAAYLDILRADLPVFLDARPWSLVIWNAGTDVLAGDWVGGLGLTPEGVLARDRFVVEQVRGRGIPLLMLPSGGYTEGSRAALAAGVLALLAHEGIPSSP